MKKTSNKETKFYSGDSGGSHGQMEPHFYDQGLATT